MDITCLPALSAVRLEGSAVFSVITGKARIQKGKRTRISGYYRYSVVVQRSPTPSDKDGWGRGGSL